MAMENFIAEAFSLLAIGLIVIGLRLYSRCLSIGLRRLAADDYLMVLAGVRYISESLSLTKAELGAGILGYAPCRNTCCINERCLWK